MPPRDLARLSRLRRSSAFDFLHQRRRIGARRLSRRLPCSKSNPSGHLFSYSINGLISEWDLFSLRQKTLAKAGIPDAASCNDMLNLYIRLGLLEKAKALIFQMKKDQTQFDEDLYKTVMRVFCREGMMSEAGQLMEEMRNVGLGMDISTRTSMMVMYGESGRLQKAEDIFKTIEHPDSAVLSQMLNIYLVNGDTSNTNKLLNSLLATAGDLSVTSQLICKFIREGVSNCNKVKNCLLHWMIHVLLEVLYIGL